MHYEEITNVSNADLPSAELADYLQLQSDATGAVRQDQHLDSSLKAAINEVETRSGRFLLRRIIETKLKHDLFIKLSIGKIDNAQINQVYFVSDQTQYLNENEYIFSVNRQSSELKILSQKKAEFVAIRFFVGHQHWDHVAADLKMAVITLAAYFYEQRYDTHKSNIGMPKLVESLIEKHRTIRI